MFKTFALLRQKELSTPYLWSGHEVLMCVHSSMNYGPLIFRGPLIKRIQNVFFIRRIQDVNTVLWSPSLTLCQLRSSNKNTTSPGRRHIPFFPPAVVQYVCFLSVAVDNLKVSPPFFFFFFFVFKPGKPQGSGRCPLPVRRSAVFAVRGMFSSCLLNAAEHRTE